MAEKIVLVTAGGHISSFHAAMKGMYDILNSHPRGDRFELWGAKGGLSGLIEGKFIPIREEHIEVKRAGSLIGADRRHLREGEPEKIAQNMREQGIYAVIMMGGDDHLKEAARLWTPGGIRIVGYPKTMDGDLSSLVTLGYHTAVRVGANVTRLHHNSAMTNGKIFYVGLFGRDTDWVPCGVSAFGGADRCIPCEQEYKWEQVWEKIKSSKEENQERFGKPFAVVDYSEGAKINEIEEPPEKHRGKKDVQGHAKLQPEWIGMELVRLTRDMGDEATFQSYTYLMRDSPPTKTDIKLSAKAGRECLLMVLDGDFGKSAAFDIRGRGYIPIRRPLEEVAVKRMLKPTGYFDYAELRANSEFARDNRILFGRLPKKERLVYRNLSNS